jgi:CheY-like chemotaxis protein
MEQKTRTILVIDDDASIREVVSLVLSSEGYKVLVAADGEEGIRLAKAHNPDGIVLDVSMPKMSGYLVATLMSRDPGIKSIPILLLTGRALMAGSVTLDIPGVSYKLGKPFDHLELIEVVGKMIVESKSGKSTASH